MKASQLYQFGRHTESEALYKELTAQAAVNDHHADLPRLHLALARLYSTMHRDIEALELIALSQAEAESVGNKNIIAEGNILRGITLAKSQQYKEALDAYNKAASYSFETNNTRRLGVIFFLIAQMQEHAENYQEAYDACKLSLHYYNECKNERGILLASTKLGAILSSLGKYSDALEELLQREKTINETGLPYIICGFYTIKARLHLAMSDHQECEAALMRGTDAAIASNDTRNLIENNAVYVALYLKTGHLQKAEEYLNNGLSLVHEIKDKHWEMKYLRLRSDLYAARGDFERAYEAYKHFHNFEKVLLKETMGERVKMIVAQHDLLEKKREAELYKLRSETLERELLSKTSHLASESEQLARFREEMKQILSLNTSAEQVLRKIKQKIQELPRTAVKWEEYDKYFHDVHPDFVKDLLEKYPDLSRTETKICSLLKVGLTTREIASILNLSDRSVENHRYRIRKKLALGDKNISQFLQSL